MPYLRLLILAICIAFYTPSANGASRETILVLNSYSQDYNWSNSVVDSIGAILKSNYPDVELTVEYLSSERVDDTSLWIDRIRLLFDSYANKKLSAIIILSDEAWMAYRAAKREFEFDGVPLFLCAVKSHSISLDSYNKRANNLSLNDFVSTEDLMVKYSATGILKEINVEGYFDLMHKAIADINNYTIITDNRFYGVYTRLMIENYLLKARSPLPIEYINEQFVCTDSLLNLLPLISSKSGVLFTSWFAEDSNYAYSKSYVYDKMCNDVKSPIFVTANLNIVPNGFIGGLYNDDGFWGSEVAQMVLESLRSGGMNQAEMKIVKDHKYNINWDVITKFNINKNNFPKGTNFINKPESLSLKYCLPFVIGIVMVLMLVSINIYVIKNNIKLKKAHKLTALAISESNIANKNLVKIQMQLKEALEMAEYADRMKSAFINSMDHQIRTPLNSIVGFSSIISTMQDRDDIEDAATQISDNSEKLLKLIKNILDISQLESGCAEYIYDRVDINGMIEDILPSFNRNIKSGITLKFCKSDKQIMLITDPTRVAQVLISLIDNAIKFTNSGVVEVGYFVVDDIWIEFFVKDSGIGIKDDEIDKVFDHFYKCDCYSVGSGLGLSISKVIINTLGGTIGVSSQIGVGSRFWFRIKELVRN